jgi:hypothetical protein
MVFRKLRLQDETHDVAALHGGGLVAWRTVFKRNHEEICYVDDKQRKGI